MDLQGVEQVDAATAQARIQQGAVLVDVREDDEWEAARVPGAVHAPLSRFMQHLNGLPDAPLVLMCAHGGRSQQAAAYLAIQGRTVCNLRGGIHAWYAAGLPVEMDG